MVGFITKKSRALLEEFDEAFSEAQILKCNRLVTVLERKAAKKSEAPRIDTEYGEYAEPGLHKELHSRKKEIAECRSDFARVQQLKAALTAEEGWVNNKKEKNGHSIYYKKMSDSDLIMTKSHTFFECETKDIPELMIKLIALFYETDLMTEYFPRRFMESHTMLHQVSRFSKITRIVLNFGRFVPVSKRTTMVIAKGFDLREEDSIMMTYETKKGDSLNEEMNSNIHQFTRHSKRRSKESKMVEFFLRGCGFMVLVPGGVVFKHMSFFDLKFDFMPVFLMNLISSGIYAYEFADGIKKSVERFAGTEWAKRVAENPAFYEDLRGRVEGFVEEGQDLYAEFSSVEKYFEENRNVVDMKKLLGLK
uniref:Uncharacterized protein n=1 Tax=Aplanochytrium stocchinoi TaxID=215587 RepID=A0A7S3LRX7_9STRA|mmetsp:Transcript_1044/g.1231  ORF Transcript_1044/g.1231 Transcript_1044/m.1231 type:complete len:364 (+) Transcript_1044:4-1095(+)|eukprot:CAMPEP_0204840628 /NCGR_PEP_ID=MMETSP1346-20131115/38321_1 /ASSEMBLY_ACC=CAM_ASM_000771 /TAXON_ID=215587 /ORGANISM="Aplanochytrium stocchinoi, Strain GSBS06" /LENGTH=363 /DNA_ID=CAMNT_0051978145 /DNA_START=150 /DNA_END=1241 /DNA_ORIENTATION=+